MRKYLRVFILALTIATLMLALGGVNAQDKKVLYTGRQMGPDDIPTLDSSVAADVNSVQIIAEIFPELARLHEETAEIQPGVATWTVSEDGLVYTFTINSDISWVRYNPETDAVEQVVDENGAVRMLSANEFVTGIRRTLDPRLASDYAYVLAPWIVGADALQALDPAAATEEEFNAAFEALGAKALDAQTLEITIPNASSSFPLIAGMWVTTAQPTWVQAEVGDFWFEPENINTYGPWALKEWSHGEDLTLIKNPFWVGTDSIPAPKIDEVVFRFLDNDPQLASYEAGELQVSEVPPSAIDRIKSDPVLSAELHSDFGTCTYYYGFNVTREPFNDPRAVLAFSQAIDRQAIVDNITKRGETPAGFFTLPSMNAAPKQEDYPEYAVATDIEGAKALWATYLAETGKTAEDFTLTILHNTSDLHASVAQAVQQMWSENLGVNVQISTQDFATYLDQRGDADIFRAAWCFDYPDTNNWLNDVFNSKNAPDNKFSNAEFDALVEQAALSSSTEERIALYAEAERILVRDAASIAPIYYYSTQDLTKPNIERTYSRITREYYEKWDISQ